MTEEHPNVTLARIVCGDDTEALAKELAIRLAVGKLKDVAEYAWQGTAARGMAKDVIRNLLIGLGCEAVVDAWEECG